MLALAGMHDVADVADVTDEFGPSGGFPIGYFAALS